MAIFPLSAGKTAWNSTVTQSWSVAEQETASGRRRAICNQLHPKITFNIEFPVLNDEELDTLEGFYALRKGSLSPFYYKDGTDYHMENQVLQKGSDGLYKAVIKMGGYILPCTHVENLHVFVNGVETTSFTEADGSIRLNTSGTVTASYDYYWLVKFDDSITATKLFKNKNRVSLKLTSVR